ncbi:MAG: hypothetical protein HQL72_10765 [Magnetococcales bacterium]|nr:hypothetical protein [Magnetococcales bacterium]
MDTNKKQKGFKAGTNLFSLTKQLILKLGKTKKSFQKGSQPVSGNGSLPLNLGSIETITSRADRANRISLRIKERRKKIGLAGSS